MTDYAFSGAPCDKPGAYSSMSFELHMIVSVSLLYMIQHVEFFGSSYTYIEATCAQLATFRHSTLRNASIKGIRCFASRRCVMYPAI